VPGAWRERVAAGLSILRLAIAVALLPLALDWRSPLLAGVRPAALSLLIAVPLILIAIDGWLLWKKPPSRFRRALSMAVLLVAGVTLTATLVLEAGFQRVRARVLAADPAQLEKLGRHFVVGYRDPAEIERLLERRAIGGVFVGARKCRGPFGRRHPRANRLLAGHPPASGPAAAPDRDRPGGRHGLAALPAPAAAAADRLGGRASRARGRAQRGGARLRPGASPRAGGPRRQPEFCAGRRPHKNLVNPNDRYTRIRDRAIAADPAIVTEIARHYCAGLREAGVRCTLKHFPGLGGVFEDTHLEAGHLRQSVAELEASDWMPFRALMAGSALTMLSHARLTALDAEHPVSLSDAVIAGLLRRSWGHDGILITDDFSMGAVYASKQGVAAASIAALNAGVDLILIAYDPAHFFTMMDAVLAAERDGRLRPAAVASSARRLEDAAIGR
jgi:beta-N-acetylhexosaminidase